MMSTLTFPLFAVLLTWALFKLAKVGRRESTLPPGPPTIPLLGNAHTLSKEASYMKFTEWAKQYGDFYSLKIGPDTAVVLTSMKAVKELMDQQGGLTCDRPKSYMADTAHEGLYVGTMRYNDHWRRLRKTMYPILNPNGAMQHRPIQAAEATQLMYDVLQSPNRVYTHLQRYSTSVITSIVFGKRFPQYECSEVYGIFEALEAGALTFQQGVHPPVDQLPFLNLIPERWARWKKVAKRTNRLIARIYLHLFGVCEERIRSGEENGCFLEGVIKQSEEYGLTTRQVAFLGGVLLEGGAHTTSAFLQWMILSLIAFPEVQRKAQEEIDRVVGQDRAPRLDDFAQLPYCQALVYETHRFRPVAPLAIPHATLNDGTYRNYFLPKGTTIFVNTWGIYHDPDVYEDPEIFNPDRYLHNEFGAKPNVDVGGFRNNIVFGSGRRSCPGIHLANTSIALNTMNLLWAFDFSPATDPGTGKPLPVDLSIGTCRDLFPAPNMFSCNIKPRSAAHAAIIEKEFLAARSVFEMFESNAVELEPVDEQFE